MTDLEQYIAQRLATIQKRHNFHPRRGARQVSDKPEMRDAYGRFDELLKLVQRLELDVPIPHDPSGLAPMANLGRRQVRLDHVYFARERHSTCWKIGHSMDPLKRRAQLQTGNRSVLYLRFVVFGEHKTEQALHRYLRRFKIQSRSKEWFDLDFTTVKSIVHRLREEGPSFLEGAPLRSQG